MNGSHRSSNRLLRLSLRPTTLAIPALTAVMSAVLVGCGSDNSGNPGPSQNSGRGWVKGGPLVNCHVETYHYCIEYPLVAVNVSERVPVLEQDCARVQGALTNGACPITNHVGTCIYDTKNGRVTARYYVPITNDEVRVGCQAGGGRFQPGY